MTTKPIKPILSERNFTILNTQPNQTILDFIDKHYKDQNVEYLVAFNGLAVLLVDQNQINVHECAVWFERNMIVDISGINDIKSYSCFSSLNPVDVRENFKFFKNTILLPQISFPNSLTLFELVLNGSDKYYIYPRYDQSIEDYFNTLYDQLFTDYELKFEQVIERNESKREYVGLSVEIKDDLIKITLSERTIVTSLFDTSFNDKSHSVYDNKEKIYQQPFGRVTEHGEQNYHILIQQVIKAITKFLSCNDNNDELEIFVNAFKYNFDNKIALQDWEI